MSRIGNALRNFRDRIRAGLTVKSQNILLFFALILLVSIAIAIRLSPIIIDNYLIKAFDPWIQYYNAEYLADHTLYEYFNWRDFKSWFPEGFNRSGLRPGLTFTVVIIYNFFKMLGIPVSLYDICFYFPAFMGGVTVFASYLLGKEVLDKKCGLLFGFFMAFNVGFMQRTAAGFFDNETVGVFGTIMTLYFFVKAIRTGRISHSILGGIFLGYLALSWGGYNYIFYLLPMIVGIIVLIGKYNTNVLIAYTGTIGTGLLIFSLYKKFNYAELFSSLDIGGVFFFIILLVIFHLIYSKKETNPRFYKNILSTVKWGIIPIIVIVAVLIWINPDLIPLGLGNRLQSILSPLIREDFNLVASVAEHSPSAWSVFYYNTLIPLMLLPLGVFFAFKRSSQIDVLLLCFILTLFYFTGSMIRIILLFAPAASLLGAYGLSNVLKIFGSFYGERRTISRKRKRQIKSSVGKFEIGLVYFIVGIMCFAQISHAAQISTTDLAYSQLTPGGQFHDWEEALTWSKTNLPGDTVIVSWWDYGYWGTVIGNFTTVNDNATVNATRIGLTGMAFSQTNEIYSAEVFRKLKADYVLVYFGFLYNPLGGDEGKWPWMLRICNDHYEKYKEMGLEKDNWADDTVFNEREYWNDTSQRPEPKWFESQIVRLMFYGLPTAPVSGNPGSFVEFYQREINQRADDNGNSWVSSIPYNGHYNFKVFKSAFNSTLGMVKIYQMDYTALDSSFKIEDPEVYDTDFATFKIINTGNKNLTISDVRINDQSYDYYLGKSASNVINSSDDDLVWVDIERGGGDFDLNDIVNITVEAQSAALEGRTYTFTNSTKNLFVKSAPEGKIRINRENSWVEQIDGSSSDIHLEVENIGQTNIVLDKVYYNSEENLFTNVALESGSAILEPGEKGEFLVKNSDVSFSPVGTANLVGVSTPNGIRDEILLTSNYPNYKITILPQDRIVSPELTVVQSSASLRDQIPIDLSSTHSYTYDNGTTILKMKLKNTGDVMVGLESIQLRETGSWINTSFTPLYLASGDEKYITVTVSDYLDIDVNDDIGVTITASYDGSTKASDIAYLHTINDDPDIQILEYVEGTRASFISANETGKLLVKNTGDEPLELNEIIFNATTVLSVDTDVNFEFGDKTLEMQECALMSFDIPGFKINESNSLSVLVNTTIGVTSVIDLSAIVNSELYNVEVVGSETTALYGDSLTIEISNIGMLNVTLDSVYINDTLVDFAEYGDIIAFDDQLELLLDWGDLVLLVGTVNVGDKLEILVRTKEGAEDTHLETVIS